MFGCRKFQIMQQNALLSNPTPINMELFAAIGITLNTFLNLLQPSQYLHQLGNEGFSRLLTLPCFPCFGRMLVEAPWNGWNGETT